MAAENFVRVESEKGSYRVWEENGVECCVQELPDGEEKRIYDYSHLPTVELRRSIIEAVKKILPSAPRVESDPWKNPNFRFGSLNSCIDCPK